MGVALRRLAIDPVECTETCLLVAEVVEHTVGATEEAEDGLALFAEEGRFVTEPLFLTSLGKSFAVISVNRALAIKGVI